MTKDRRVTFDPTAASSDSSRPGFLARPVDSPVYHGFTIVPETYTDGWCLGTITDFEDPDGCMEGDAFVVAPDGSRAGLVWEVGTGPLEQALPPTPGRWGVYAVWFPHPTRTVDDLVSAFRAILPQLKEAYDRANADASK